MTTIKVSKSSLDIAHTLIRDRRLSLPIIILISIPILRTCRITTEKVFYTIHEISFASWLPWIILILCLIIISSWCFSLFHFLYLLHVLCVFSSFIFFGTHSKLLMLISLTLINSLCQSLCLYLTLSLTLYLLLNSHLLFYLPRPFYFFLLHLLSHLLVS